MALQVLQRLYEHARTRGGDVAVCQIARNDSEDRTITFADLAGMVRSTAAVIEEAVPPGGVVLICQPNRIECTVAFLAALHARAAGFLINPGVSADELRRAAATTSAQAMIGTPANCEALRGSGIRRLSIPELPGSAGGMVSGSDPPDDVTGSGLMLLSSGTTGDPKIVHRDGRAVDAVARNVAEATGLSPDDRLLAMIPLCHSYGVEHGMLAPIFAGCAVHLCQGFDTRVVFERLATGGITILPGVPSIFEMLATLGDGRRRFPTLRLAYSAGASLPMSVLTRCRDNLRLRVGQLYGSSEVGSVTFNDPHGSGHDATSAGRPMSGVRIRIVDPKSQDLGHPLPTGVEGEVAIHAPSMLHAYVGQSESPLRDEYFLTGDLGRLDADGAMTITGRIKLLIDVGALKVNPHEVELALLRHRGVRECVVMPLPVTDTISRVRALVVPADASHPPSVDSLRRFARDRLSAHKVPRVFKIVDSLPKSSTGKILRRQLVS